MKYIIFILPVLLIFGATNNARTIKLDTPLANVKSGSVKFAAELINSTPTSVTVKNLSTGELVTANAPARPIGKQGNITLNLNGGYATVVSWFPIKDDGVPIGSISEVSGDYVKVNERWYRVYDVKFYQRSPQEAVGRQAYANGSRVEKIDL